MPSALPASHVEARLAKLRGWVARLREELEAEAMGRDEGSPAGFADKPPRKYACGVCGGRGCLKCHGGKVTISEPDAYRLAAEAAPKPNPSRALDEQELAKVANMARNLSGEVVALGKVPLPPPLERDDREIRLIRHHERLRGREPFLVRLERALVDGATLEELAATFPGPIPKPPREF